MEKFWVIEFKDNDNLPWYLGISKDYASVEYHWQTDDIQDALKFKTKEDAKKYLEDNKEALNKDKLSRQFMKEPYKITQHIFSNLFREEAGTAKKDKFWAIRIKGDSFLCFYVNEHFINPFPYHFLSDDLYEALKFKTKEEGLKYIVDNKKDIEKSFDEVIPPPFKLTQHKFTSLFTEV